MREHEQFGRPPNLRPRSAGVARASPRSVPLEQLAREANSHSVDAATMLSERLHMPRPGSASTRIPVSPRLAAATLAPMTSAAATSSAMMDKELKPTVLLSKPPARPRSALMGSRGIVSQHRRELLQQQSLGATTAVITPSNQTTNETAVLHPMDPFHHASQSLVPQLHRVARKSEKEDGVPVAALRPSSASIRSVGGGLSRPEEPVTVRPPLKRPFSAAPAMGIAVVPTAPALASRTAQPVALNVAPPAKRPFSAAAAVRGASPRSSALQSKATGARTEASLPEHSTMSERAPPTRVQAIGGSSHAMAIMTSYHRDTFVYAVPRHCLERGRQYNPYDIVTVSHCGYHGNDETGGSLWNEPIESHDESGAFRLLHGELLGHDVLLQRRQLAAKLPLTHRVGAAKSQVYTDLDAPNFSTPVLNAGMKEIQIELQKLDSVNLMLDFEGVTHHMSRFSAKNSDHVQRQGFEILKITGRIQQVLLTVCHESLSSTDSPYGGFPGHEFALSTRKSSNIHIFEEFIERERALATASDQLVHHQHFQTSHASAQPSSSSLSAAAQLRTTHRKYIERVFRAQQQRPQDAMDEIRWTMAAIQRRRCLQLTKFIALVDFMVLDALHSMLTRSIQLLRDSLWVGANAGAISRLFDRREYVLAFHRTLETQQTPPKSLGERGYNPSSVGEDRSASPRKLQLNKQQTKRFLRTAWERPLAALLRSSSSSKTSNSESPSGRDPMDEQHIKSSAAVWLESRLESFFMQALAQHCGVHCEHFGIDELMHVVEHSMSQALVLPDFDAALCAIEASVVTAQAPESSDGYGSGTTAEIQQIEALAPVALFHIGMELQVEEPSKRCAIVFKPTLDRVAAMILEAVSSFVELFRGIPSIVLHHDLRAILEFAEDFRAASIMRDGASEDNQGGGPRPGNSAGNDGDEDEDDESRWNKSNYDRLFFRISVDQSCSMLRMNIDELTSSAVDGANEFTRRYEDVLAAFTRNEKVDFEQFRVRFRRGEYTLTDMERDARGFAAQIEHLQQLKDVQTIEFLQFNMAGLKEALLPSPVRCLAQVHALFPSLALEKCETFLAFVRNACKKIEKPIVGDSDLESFARYLLHLRDVQDDVDHKEADFTFIENLFRTLGRLEIDISAQILEVYELCDPEFEALKSQLSEALAKRAADIHERSPLLAAHIKTLTHGIETLKTSSADQAMNSGDSVSHEARDLAHTLEIQAGELSQRSTQLVWVQRVFEEFAHNSRPPLEEFSELQVVSNELKLKNELWEAVNDAEEYLKTKQDETLRDIDLGQLRSILLKVDAVIKRLQQTAMQIGAIKRLDNCKAVLEGLSPVIRDLRNENLEERHWTKLEHKMNCTFVRHVTVTLQAAATSDDDEEETDLKEPSPTHGTEVREVKFLDLPLRHLLEIEAVNHAGVIHQVSEEATAEAAVTKSFLSVAQTWETREIPSQSKKDRDGRDAIYLGDCSEIMTLVEESEVLLRVMESSSYSRVIHVRLAKLLQDLAHTKETMELLVVCYQKWEYLQRLVSADFVRLFPEQGKALQTHDANWKGIMDDISKRPLCLPFGINTQYRQTLLATLQGFEVAAKHMEQHLELKRQAFPAFFKLSNTELATLLSKVRDINTIQQFLYQCFDNVARFNFGTREACQDVLSLTSRAFPHAETIAMGKNLKARGPPEQWLVSVEKRLVEMLRKATKEAVVMLSQASSSSSSSAVDAAALNALPLHSILLADRILRCELIDSLVVDDDTTGSTGASVMSASHERIYKKLHQFHASVMDRVLGSSSHDPAALSMMSPREIVLMSSLNLHEIEFRDAIDDHFLSARTGNSSGGTNRSGLGIQWQLQLKHRFDDTTTVGYDCHVEMDGARIPYGFNYVNPNAELVFTPRSLRFVFSIFAATRHAQTALLTGPAGSGKQTLALQISRLFGRRYFGFSASESMGTGSLFCQAAHCLRLVRGALQVGGVMCIALQQCVGCIDLLRVLSSTVSRIEHSVLCKLPITGLQKDPIAWVPGTTLLLSCRLLPPASPQWERMQHEFSIAAANFSRIAVAADHDSVLILEALVYSKRLEAPQRTAQKLFLLWRHLNSLDCWVSSRDVFTMRTAKQVIAIAAQDAWKNTESFDREGLQSVLICEAVLRLLSPFIRHASGSETLMAALDDVFQYRHHQKEWYTRQWKRQQRSNDAAEFKKCEELIEEAAQDLHFVPRRQLALKSVELARGLVTNVGVVLLGPSGVGKTTTYRVLASAMDQWKHELVAESYAQKAATVDPASGSGPPTKSSAGTIAASDASATTVKPDAPVGPFVSIHVVLPMSLTLDQLFSSTSNDPKGQIKSLIGRLIRGAQESFALSTDREIQLTIDKKTGAPSLAPILAMQKLTWVVFDGGAVCGGVWLDVLVSILTRKFAFGLLDCCEDPGRELVRFQDGEFMTIPPNLRFVFESCSLDNATPAVLQQCALVVFPAESEAIHLSKDDDVDALPIHFACIQRFLEQQRLAATSAPADQRAVKLASVVYDTVTNRLLGTDILAKIRAVMNDYGVSVRLSLLQRVEYLLSMLQALLNSVAVSCSSSQKPHDVTSGPTASGVFTVIPEQDVQQRVDMAIVYALLWGFSACCASGDDESRCRALQLLISGMLKSHFEEIAHSWEDCGRDANLFELLIDINGLRFVSLASGDTTILRDKIWRHTLATFNGTGGAMAPSMAGQQFHALFIPTQSSLLVHAAMKEAIRSARGVLLVGAETSRRTSLLQNFLKQLEPIRILTTSSYASIPPPASTPNGSGESAVNNSTRRKRAVPLLKGLVFANTENAHASLDRIRLHQVGLVKRLAKRFRKVNKDAAAAATLAAAQRYGSSRSKSGDAPTDDKGDDKKSKTDKKQQDWMLQPHLDDKKASMVSKFDLGDFIPFFFAMNQHDRGVHELAKCLERMLQRERTGVFEPPPGKAAVLIIDDLHLPVSTQDEEHPSIHEYLRSVYEHATVLSSNVETAGATPIKIENLMMVASIASRGILMTDKKTSDDRDDTPISTRHHSLDKLTKQLFPVYASPCSLVELHTIFHTLLVAQWESLSTSVLDKLTPVVRQMLPVVVAATTMLFEKLRRRWRTGLRSLKKPTPTGTTFDLHVLKRVYAGVCAVEPSYILDAETMARLWAHEVSRSFGDVNAIVVPQWKSLLKTDVFKVRILLDGLDLQQLQQRSSSSGASAPVAAFAGASSTIKVTNTVGSTALSSAAGGDHHTRSTNLNTETTATACLGFFANELLTVDKKPGELGISAQQRMAYERLKLHVVSVWAFVPSALYYQTSTIDANAAATAGGIVGQASHPSPLQRRNSVKFMRRKSLENVVDPTAVENNKTNWPTASKIASLGSARWIYAELPLLDSSGEVGSTEDATITQAIQSIFSGIRIFGATTTDSSSSAKPVTDLLLQIQVAQLPRTAPPVTPLMARSIAQLERVVTPQGSRVVLVAPPGSGRELFLRYACAVRQTSQPQSIWTMEGVPDDKQGTRVMAKKWKHIVHQLFHHVGVEYESVTLIVKKISLWPPSLISQLTALIVSGEIPSAFTLEEQIKLATRVRDERLIELDQRYQSQTARIRQEVELQKDQELLARNSDGTDATQPRQTATSAAAFYQELERKHQHVLLLRLSQAQVRHQQEVDDFLRKCEVENESVTATIMSLMRPLGMTSGKWQQIVQRVRKRLKIVVLVDSTEYPAVEKVAPQLLRVCSIASLSPLDLPSLQTALYGCFRTEFQAVFRRELLERGDDATSSSGYSGIDDRVELAQFVDCVENELPAITAVAAEMHTCAKSLAALESRVLPTELGVMLARFFAKLLRFHYQCERDERRKAEWFTHVYASMEKALWKLQDRDGELRSQLASCDQQIEISQELLTEQKDDCDRIRDMMKRYHDAAEEQVQVTNEMELRAQAELHVPMACLEEANAALLMIDKRHIIEIKSFNSPPLLVHFVLDAICVMFKLEPAWENARKILSDANVVHTLLTFDKDNISVDILTKLETTYICDPRFHREEVEKQSVAASMMVVWVRAIYQYATARRQVMPTLDKLEQAQSRLKLLMQEYQVSKQRVVEAAEALAKTKETLEKAQEVRKQTVDEIESRKTRLDGGRVVLAFLGDDKFEADKVLRCLQSERDHGLTWWNALLAAGTLVYGSYFDASDRCRLFTEWAQVVRRVVATASTELVVVFTPAIAFRIKATRETTTAQDEASGAVELDAGSSTPSQSDVDPRDPRALFSHRQRYWEFASACGFLFSERSLQNAFLLTQTARAGFPVILVTTYSSEMEDLMVKCARHIWRWSHFFMVSAKASDLETTLLTALQEGHQLLILDVEPLDVEYKLGKLWWLFHWNRSTPPPSEAGDPATETTEHLSIPTFSSSTEIINAETSGKVVAVHSAFRAIFTTHRHGAAFGDTLLTRVPVISAQLHTPEVPDLILDKLWHPGLFEGGQHGFGLKQSVRDFERLHRQSEDAQTELTKLIQGAAVRGQFEREETDLIRTACDQTKHVRLAIVHKRDEIYTRMKSVQKMHTLSRLGAAIFSGINHQPQGPPRLSMQLFLPLFMAAVKKPAPVATSAASSPLSLSRVASSNSGSGHGLTFRSIGRAIQFGSQQQASAASIKGNGFESISEIMRKMLEQLMPLVRDVFEWYEFVAHMLWLLERQYPVEGSPPNAAAQEAAMKSIDAMDCEKNDLEPRVRRLLSIMKIGHWKSQAVCEDYVNLPVDMENAEQLVALVINGHSQAVSTSTSSETKTCDGDGMLGSLTAVFAASRCRAERVKTAMSMYPHLVRSLCDRILQVYGVQVRFTPSEIDAAMSGGLVTSSPTKPISRQLSSLSQGLPDESSYSSLPNESHGKPRWLQLLHGLPAASIAVIQTETRFGSYALLCRALQATTSTSESRLVMLKIAMARSFKTSSDLDNLFVLPHQRLQSGSALEALDRSLSTLADTSENALMVRDFAALVGMSRDKLESFLDDVPLAIIQLDERHGDADKMATQWEDLFHMIHASPERTTSTELRRFESCGGGAAPGSTASHGKADKPAAEASSADAASPLASGAIALVSPGRGSTARRFSTQNLQHRRSDAASILNAASTTTSLMAVTSDIQTIPDHLRASVVAFATEATELGSDRVPSLSQCLQETLVRVAFHPWSELLSQFMVSTSDASGAGAKAQVPPKSSGESNPPDTDPLVRLLWHYLTALVVFHALLLNRWQLSRRQYKSSPDAANSPAEKYSWDVLTTAVDQLFQVLLQLRGTTKASSSLQLTQPQMEALLTRVTQQVFLASYTRQARAPRELEVLRLLSRECLCLVQDSTITAVSTLSTSHASAVATSVAAPGISSSRNLRSHRLIQLNSSSMLLPSSTNAPTAPAGYNASSRKMYSRRSSLGDGVGSLVSGLNLPLETLRTSVKDINSWLDATWLYANQIDSSIESLVRDLFGLLPPCEIALVSHPAASPASESWSERFGWIKQPVRYGSIAAQFAVDDALQCLKLIYDNILPPVIEEHHVTHTSIVQKTPVIVTGDAVAQVDNSTDGHDMIAPEEIDTPTASRSSLGSVSDNGYDNRPLEGDEKETDARTEGSNADSGSNARMLHDQCVSSFTSCYNTHIQALRSMLEEMICELEFWRTHSGNTGSIGPHGRHQRQTLASVADVETREAVLMILCNRVPAKLRNQTTTTPTYLFTAENLSLDALVAHYQRWYDNLMLQRQFALIDATRVWCEWWLPGVPAQTSVGYLIHVAKQRLAHKLGVPLDSLDQEFEVVFSLRVETAIQYATDPESRDPVMDGAEKESVLVLTGLELRMATWDTERGYLQTLDRHNCRVPQRVSVVCCFEKRATSVVSGPSIALPLPSVQQTPGRKRGLSTRSCPLMDRGDVVHEFELPIGPAFGSLVAPYLTFGAP